MKSDAMKSDDIPISELIKKYYDGEIRLPELQRSYIWSEKQVSEFFYSLYFGHPTGTILTWKIDGKSGIPTRQSAIEQGNSEQTELLLDGQQRLTSLTGLLIGKFFVTGKKKKIDIRFNLNHPHPRDIDKDIEDIDNAKAIENYERLFFAPSQKKVMEKQPEWISVRDFFKKIKNLEEKFSIEEFLREKGFNNSDSNFLLYQQRLENLKDILGYKFRVNVLEKSTRYSEVGQIFVRVNSAGTRLKGSDLALAQITVKWPKSLVKFEEFVDECGKQGFNFDIGTHVRNLVVFTTGQCKFKSIMGYSDKNWENSWEKAKDNMRYALNFLRDNVKIDTISLLSSPYLAISIAYYKHKRGKLLSNDEEKKLKRWILLANTNGRYTRASSENALDADLLLIKDDIDSALDKLISELAKNIKTNIEASDLKGLSKSSTHFKTIYMAFRDSGAKDWLGKSGIGPENTGKQKAEAHHIFPKAVLNDLYLDNKKVNDIANLAFITSDTNKALGGEEPIEYVKKIPDYKELFPQQCIPFENDLLEVDNYDEFLEKRRELIAKRLNEFLGNEDS